MNFLIWKGKKKFLEAWGLHFQVLDTEFILKRNITKKKKFPKKNRTNDGVGNTMPIGI